MSTELTIHQKSLEVSRLCGDTPITTYFRALVAEQTGVVITPDMPKTAIRKAICDFEERMREAEVRGQLIDESNLYPVKHYFTDGVVARSMFIPKGSVIVGKIHRHEHLNFLTKGHVTVVTEEGGMEELWGGMILVSPVAAKRLLIAHEDTMWTVVHRSEAKNPAELEEEVIAKDYSEFSSPQLELNLEGVH